MSDKKKGETCYCGDCFKRFSYLDYSQPAKALQDHLLSECPGVRKA